MILKQVFCKHKYKSLEWWQEENYNERYSKNKIRCVNCNKERIVNGDIWHFGLKENQKAY